MGSRTVVDCLAAYRATRLVTKDTITRPVRARIIRHAYRAAAPIGATVDDGTCLAIALHGTESEVDDLPHDDPDTPKLAAFIICPYCVGLWISFGVVAARRYAGVLWEPLARALALSAVAALVARVEDG